MNGAGFIEVVAWNLVVFDDFDDGGLAGFLIVFDRLGDPEIEAAARDGLLEMGEEFVFEDAVDQRVRLLG